jgi:PAP2 superfamily
LAAGAYADYTGYQPVNTVDRVTDPTRWQPLRFSTGATPGFMAPHWGNVTPFALSSGSALRLITTLPTAGSAEYREQADYILELTSRLTDEQKMIAEYWANGPRTELPPGHWNLFAQELSRQHQQGLDADVVMYFLQGNAVMDAGIACWDCKRHYDAARPITAIRSLYAGQTTLGFVSKTTGIASMSGETWSPWQPTDFITPPFAEFTSGHSTFSTASAEIFKRFFGSDTFGASAAFTSGQSSTETNVPKREITLRWSTFTAAADEAGLSRLYGGIHFERANSVGKTMGRQVGAAVWDKTQRLLAGQRA